MAKKTHPNKTTNRGISKFPWIFCSFLCAWEEITHGQEPAWSRESWSSCRSSPERNWMLKDGARHQPTCSSHLQYSWLACIDPSDPLNQFPVLEAVRAGFLPSHFGQPCRSTWCSPVLAVPAVLRHVWEGIQAAPGVLQWDLHREGPLWVWLPEHGQLPWHTAPQHPALLPRRVPHLGLLARRQLGKRKSGKLLFWPKRLEQPGVVLDTDQRFGKGMF